MTAVGPASEPCLETDLEFNGDRDAAAGLAVLGIWAANKKADREAQEEARRRLHQKLFPSDSAVLESKRWTRLEKRHYDRSFT